MLNGVKVIITCLCLGVIFNLRVCVGESAETNGLAQVSGDYHYYVLDDTYISLARYIGEDEVVVIPSEIEQKKVIKISKGCFEENVRVRKIVIPDGVTYIDDGAFAGCGKLSSVTIPDTVQYIGYGVFNASGIRSFRMPKGITVLDHALVEACPNLRKIILTDLKELDTNNVNLMNNGCPKLKEFKIESENSPFFTIKGVLFQRYSQKLIGFTEDDVVSLVAYPQAKKDQTYYIPNGVMEVMDRAFSGCRNLEKLILSDGVKKMRVEVDARKPLTLIILNKNINLVNTYYQDHLEYYTDSRLTIQSWTNSSVERFARKNNIPFMEWLGKGFGNHVKVDSVEGRGYTERVEDLEEYWAKTYPESMEKEKELEESVQKEVEGNVSEETGSRNDRGAITTYAELDGDEKEPETGGFGRWPLMVGIGVPVLMGFLILIRIALTRKVKVNKEKRKERFSREWAAKTAKERLYE